MVCGSDTRTAGDVRPRHYFALIAIASAILSAVIVTSPLPHSLDWHNYFAGLDWRDPYSSGGFVMPPHSLLLAPHMLLPFSWWQVTAAINLALNIAVLTWYTYRSKGGPAALALAILSPAGLDMILTNNLDWLPLIGMMLPPAAGLLFLSTRPHVFGAAAIVWLRQHGLKPFYLTAAAAVVGLLLYGLWPLAGRVHSGVTWNFSAWPVSIAPGAYLLWRAWQNKDATLAALCTPLLMPYVGLHSLTPIMAVLAGYDRKAALFVFVGLWLFWPIHDRFVFWSIF